MRLSQMFIERFRELETNSRGKLYSHKLAEQLQQARAFAARVDRDGSDIVYIFPDRSRLRVINPMQLTDKATFTVLSNIA